MGFSRQEYWSGLPFPSPGDLPDPGMELRSPALAGGFFTSEPPGKPYFNIPGIKKKKRKCREFPVGPVVRIWWFYCRGFRVNAWSRTKIPHDTQCFPQKSSIIKHYQILCERVGVIETGWAQSTGMGWDYLVYNYWFYLFDYTKSYLQHSGSLTFDAAYGVFSRGMGTLSCGIEFPDKWSNPGPAFGAQSLSYMTTRQVPFLLICFKCWQFNNFRRPCQKVPGIKMAASQRKCTSKRSERSTDKCL